MSPLDDRPRSERLGPETSGFLRAIGWFIPEGDWDRVTLLRAQLYVVLSGLITGNTALFAMLHSVHHVPGTNPAAIWVLIAMSGVSLVLPFLLKWGRSMTALSLLFLGVLQGGVVTVAVFDGGLESGAMFWLVVAPIAAAFLGGAPMGWTASGVSVAAGLVMFGASRLGHTFPTSLSPVDSSLHLIINFTCCVGFVVALAALYEGPMVRHFQDLSLRLRTINADLRRELDERQRAQVQAEAASRAKDVLLANMSHEFRTPLTAILGFTEILADEAVPDHRPLLESIDRGGRRLLNTLNGVLDLAWIEGSDMGIAQEPVDARALVGETASRFLPTAVQRGLSFEVSGDEATVLADVESLRRALAAVVDNAIRFTERGSVVVSIRNEGEVATIFVSDTGIGMPPDFVTEALQPFRQASEGDARTHEGVGVGLTIAQRLVDMMGGELSIESTPGRGTVVALQLPTIVPAAASVAEPAHEVVGVRRLASIS